MAEETKKKSAAKKKPADKKKSEPSVAVKAEREVKEETLKAEIAKATSAAGNRACAVCGKPIPVHTGYAVENEVYVCSKKCLAVYGKTHREHAHR